MLDVNGGFTGVQSTQQRANRLTGADKAKLAKTILELDRECQDLADKIEALTCGATALLDGELLPYKRSAITKMPSMIGDLVATVSNDVNWQAEQVGCNHVGEVNHD
ncbi:MAG: hypothetical protein KGL42_07910 [Betaproteobacteria bacterium]|nr:hypothetical protein [Betaproteobacteria bacterium]